MVERCDVGVEDVIAVLEVVGSELVDSRRIDGSLDSGADGEIDELADLLWLGGTGHTRGGSEPDVECGAGVVVLPTTGGTAGGTC